MVKILYYGEINVIDQIPENYYDFVQICGDLFSISEVEKHVFEFSHDNKNFILLNPETYNNLFLEGKNETTVFIFMSLEETNYFQNKQKEEEKNIKTDEIKSENEIKTDEIKTDENEIKNENEIKTDEIKTDENEIKNENEIKTDQIKTDENENENDDDGGDGIKVPPITKEMVINSIVQQVRERMQQSRLLLQQKEKEEKEKEEKERKEKEEREKKEKEEQKGVSNQINNLISNRLDNLKEELINESQIKFSQIISESQLNLNKMYEENCINDNHENNKEIIYSMEKHPGFACNKCGMNPIVGNRYCCVYCNNVNYCEKCEEENGLIHGHPLYKFKLRLA